MPDARDPRLPGGRELLASVARRLSVQLEPERLRLAADRLVGYPYAFWHYGDSIGFEGLLAAAELLNEPRYAAFAHGALRCWAARRRPFDELDNTVPGHALCLVSERTGDDALVEAALDLAAFLADRGRLEGAFVSFARAPLREPYGGESLPPSERALLDDPGPGVFVDCPHFDPPFFAHLGTLAGRPDLVELGAAQALAYVRLLQDDDGLFWHFRLARTGERYGKGWSRGQGWALLGLLDTLAYLPPEHVARAELEGALSRLADTLARCQLPDGSWPRVVVEPGSGPESSAAVWASTRASHYRHVPTGFDVPWGQGPLLVAALRVAQSSSAG